MADAAATEEPKVKKTELARTIAADVLKKNKGEMKMKDIIAAVLEDPRAKAADIAEGTISAQVSRDAADDNGKITKGSERATYKLR